MVVLLYNQVIRFAFVLDVLDNTVASPSDRSALPMLQHCFGANKRGLTLRMPVWPAEHWEGLLLCTDVHQCRNPRLTEAIPIPSYIMAQTSVNAWPTTTCKPNPCMPNVGSGPAAAAGCGSAFVLSMCVTTAPRCPLLPQQSRCPATSDAARGEHAEGLKKRTQSPSCASGCSAKGCSQLSVMYVLPDTCTVTLPGQHPGSRCASIIP
jgi:hypothetical protein